MVKWNKVTHASLFISFITMTLMAYGGYATFTSSVQGMYDVRDHPFKTSANFHDF